MANGLAWAVLLGLAVVAILVADLLGFAGLLLLGLMTCLVCSGAALHERQPSWPVPGQGLERPSPERRAAAEAERQAEGLPLRFYRRCGIALALIGGLGLGWTLLQ